MGDTESIPLDQPEPGLSVTDAAELLGVSASTVRAHLRQGTLAGEKIDGSWVVYLAGLPQPSAPLPPAQPAPLPDSDQPAPTSPSRVGTLGRLVLLMLQGLSRQLAALRARVARA
jgi:excisionase family DNA binding protein